jgi:cellulose synthase/poly-beta-1,6-N-acetylglucosamine synthase-like glycosyltransferase
MMSYPNVFLALLVKQKEAVLPLFLESLENWDYPKENIYIYIRTNNNTDNTKELLEKWIDVHGSAYKGLIYNSEDVPEKVERYDVHFWNGERFRVLGKIRQESMNQALLTDC